MFLFAFERISETGIGDTEEKHLNFDRILFTIENYFSRPFQSSNATFCGKI